MNHTTKLIIIILLMTTLGYCKKKEESKPIEESSATTENEPTQDEQGPPRVAEIQNPSIPSPATFINIKEAKGDLDGDKVEELVAVYDTKREGDLGTEREIHIFKKKADKWDLLHKSIGAILPSRGGGMMGEPFEDLTIENGAIVIRHFGGSREKWSYTHRYRLQKDNWFLIGATLVFSAPCEAYNTYDYNLSTGKVDITNTIESCDETGEPKGKSKTKTSSAIVKSQKSVLMDGFEPGSQEVKLTKDKSFYF